MIVIDCAREIRYSPHPGLNTLESKIKPSDPSPVYLARVWKQGSSIIFPLCKLAAQAIGAVPGQKLLIRVHKPYITFRVINPDELLPVDGFTVDELPPKWPRREKHTEGAT